MNWLHLGQPCAVPQTYRAAAPLTGEQKGIVQRLRRLGTCWRDAEPVTAADMGRTAGKVGTLEEMLDQLIETAAQFFQSQAQALQKRLGVRPIQPRACSVKCS